MYTFEVGQTGLKMDSPAAGDIVTIKLIKRAARASLPIDMPDLLGIDADEAEMPRHFLMTTIWRVMAVNGGHAVIEPATGDKREKREVLPIGLYEWFEARELLDAYQSEAS